MGSARGPSGSDNETIVAQSNSDPKGEPTPPSEDANAATLEIPTSPPRSDLRDLADSTDTSLPAPGSTVGQCRPDDDNRTLDVPWPADTGSARRTTADDPMATLGRTGTTADGQAPGETGDFSQHTASYVGPGPGSPVDEALDPYSTVAAGVQDGPSARPRVASERTSIGPRIPGYELLKKLGEGGMGVVYLARQTGLNRRVALKMIRGGDHARPEHFARFRIEAEAVAHLRHPNILQIYEIGAVDDLPFVSLELLEGGDLAGRLDGTPQPGRPTAELLITLAGAMQTAHDAGIVHRDLKPPNVLFTEGGLPKVADFGLAKRMDSDSRQTEAGQVMGSPCYMAPEQARCDTKDVGPAADIYALGAILYEMLTGRPPFRGETPWETVRQVIGDEVVLPSRLVPRMSTDLETICLKCLNKDPEKRYLSASALADDLRRYLNGEPILARRTPVVERAAKWARRKPLAAALLCLGTTIFLSIPPVWMVRQQRLYLAEQQRSRRAIELLREGDRLVDAARDARSKEELSSAQLAMTNFLGGLKGEKDARIEGLPQRIDASLRLVDRQLRELTRRDLEQRTVLERQKGDLAEKQRFRTFVGLRTRAQLSAAEFDLGTGDRSAAFRTVRDALAVYARDPKAADERWELATPLPEVLTDGEKRLVADGCYDLLMVLSRSVEPTAGVKILDRAAKLRPETSGAFHLRRADCLARAGELAASKKELELASKAAPVTALDHLLIGREHTARRQWEEAIRVLETALRLEPNQASAKLLLAICEYNVQPRRLDEALSHLNDLIGTQSDLAGLYALRALVHGEHAYQTLSRIDRGRPAEVKKLLQQAETAFQSAEADYRTVLDHHPSDDLRYVLLVNRGGMLLRAGRIDDAIVDLNASIERNPGDYQAHATLGQLYQQAARLDEASQELGRAIERAPDDVVRVALHRGRGRLYANRRNLSKERLAAALADLDEAIRLEPRDGDEKAGDHAERARLLFGAGRFDEALAACGAATSIAPDQPVALQLKISSLMALKRYDEVLGSCNAFLAIRQPTVEVLEIRGLARLARQNYSGAIDDYGQALGLPTAQDRETRTRLLNKRGWAYHFADAARLARDDFEASLKLDPNQSDALAGRGLGRIRLGEWRPASPTPTPRSGWPRRRAQRRTRKPPARPISTPRGSTPRRSSSPPER